jgi:murein DD-endopeptidase MepM/ murein hydrolase activator NlpD
MRRLRFCLALAVVLAAVVLALSGRWPWRRLEAAAPVALSMPVQVPIHETSDTLRGGETLGDLFERQGLAAMELVRLFQDAGLDPRRLRAGLVIQFRRQAGEETPSQVSLRSGPKERLAVKRVANAWSAERHAVAWRTEVVRFEGPIGRSLYDALDESIPDDVLDADNRVRLAWDLADVYAWSIDFNRDIQPGDRFAVLMEREISEEGEVRSGGILGADLLVSGKHLNAFRFEGEDGSTRYYDADGNSLRRAFLRVPVEFRRISSSFSRARFHPVLGIWRKHEGTDYAAASGTPVMAAGDGTVLRAAWAGGYGNLIEIRHRSGIATRYGHLRAFARGIHPGSRVEQGDIIGYVGATGLASGAHLHYEFRVNGVARDSRRVDLAGGEPLPAGLLPLFQRARDKLASALGEAGQISAALKAE